MVGSGTVISRRLGGLVALGLSLAPFAAFAGPFSAGNLVVLGSGGQPANTPNLGVIDGVNRANGLTDTPSQVFLREYSFGPSGPASGTATLRQTINLPSVATTSGNRAFTLASNSGSEGALTRSADGRYLTAAGYNASIPPTLITQSASGQSAKFPASTVERVVARIDGSGAVDTTTALRDAFNGDNVRGVVSTNGSQFWLSGNVSGAPQANSGGIRYADLGATTSSRVAGADNGFTRNTNRVNIFDGQLYASTRNGTFSGIWEIGSGTSATTTGSGTPKLLFSYDATTLGGQGPYDFYLLHLDGDGLGIGINTAYVADAILGISKFTKDTGGTWRLAYTFASTGGRFETDGRAGGVTGLTGTVLDAGRVALFGVTGFNGTGDSFGGNRLISLLDTGAAASYAILATAGSTEHLTGVAFAPTDVPEPASWMLVLGASGFMGVVLRRRGRGAG